MDPVELTTADALRAYAHPTRTMLVGLLRRHGPFTATRAAELTGESVPSCSYHLRMLAKYGLVEQADGGHGRERPWRVKAASVTWSSYSPDPSVAEAATALDRAFVRRYARGADEWLDRRRNEPPEWQAAPPLGDMLLYLTADELAEVGAQVRQLVERYARRADDPASLPDGARRVIWIQLVYPDPDQPDS